VLENFEHFESNVLDCTVGLTDLVISLNAVEGVAVSVWAQTRRFRISE